MLTLLAEKPHMFSKLKHCLVIRDTSKALTPITINYGIKVCTISFERPEASPLTFTVLVQLSAFHYLTAS